jgi:putative hydrolase of the HAD superfamily
VELKAICFDAAGTLVDTVIPIGESYASLADRYGVKVSPVEIEERFRNCYSSSPPLAFPGAGSGELKDLERKWWRNLVRKIFEPHEFPLFENYFSELFAYFGKTENWTLYPETKETLAVLKDRNFILLVISNFDSRLLAILDGLGIASYFDSVFLSSQAGHAKPSPEIFHSALRAQDLKPHEAMHVGDSVEHDAMGAARAGLKAVWLNRNGGASRSIPEVRSLKEVLTLIDPGRESGTTFRRDPSYLNSRG